MKLWKKSEEGFTLVELLASIALLSVVILLVGSVHIFGQSQFINQTESASQSNDLRYSLSMISRDVRSAEVVTVEGATLRADDITYTFSNSTLTRNSEILSNRVGRFVPEMLPDGVHITISSTDNRQNQSKEYETTIYFRR
ncbi:type II secretion system protein [Alkalibacterium olivapovliticus]|uniref:Prepilin-type N-terminal cleavage/methylation domain-containing protein n=1 Tax=Alkalibacterium olivapovliticus TaxID=99907 RepID=A0A2T0W949_9LACT|nr:type II secretion system protein [Alkalibacterium olivapovliticus]PRY83229.1 prepilin-type N-terminal cleavage/methylation domain-containing protein [Alkalibacterium olivapovliticus]